MLGLVQISKMRLAAMNAIVSWFVVIGMVIGPFLLGVVFEQKLQPAMRELGSRLLHRY